MKKWLQESIMNLRRNSNIIKARYVKKDDCYKGNILSSFALKRLIDYVNWSY